MSIPINIASEQVAKYARSIPGLNLMFSNMENVERWVVKQGQDQGFMADFKQRLHALKSEDVERIGKCTDELLWILFFMPTSTAFFLQNELAEAINGYNLNDILLDRAVEVMESKSMEDKRHAQVFIDRCTHLNASNFLSSLIEKPFVDALARAVERTNKDAGNVY